MTASRMPPPTPRVLVVDDDEGVRATIEILLADAGLEVICAGDVDQGIDLLAAHPVDLVITDMQMPARSGSEMIAEARRRNPRVPIIAMSGNSKMAETGADRVIEKPFDCDELSVVVRALLPTRAGAAGGLRADGRGGR